MKFSLTVHFNCYDHARIFIENTLLMLNFQFKESVNNPSEQILCHGVYTREDRGAWRRGCNSK